MNIWDECDIDNASEKHNRKKTTNNSIIYFIDSHLLE